VTERSPQSQAFAFSAGSGVSQAPTSWRRSEGVVPIFIGRGAATPNAKAISTAAMTIAATT